MSFTRIGRTRCIRMIAAALVGGAILVVAPGCLLVAAGAGAGAGVFYAKGDLEASVNGDPPRVVAAAESALEEMDIAVLSATATKFEGEVTARTALDKKVTITVERLNDSTSALAIRVGTLGDEDAGRQIFDQIRDHLREDAGEARAMEDS